uniref:Uncharacterized protein n=1 Tax=Rhizophagus irregularis (strain DAOM 181602 / DAOM 197198 / MUCL 43194) TaxID=747089 RepID=U9T7H3_RHIID
MKIHQRKGDVEWKAKEDDWVAEAISGRKVQQQNASIIKSIRHNLAKGKQEGRLMEDESNMNPSSSKANQADAMKEREISVAG